MQSEDRRGFTLLIDGPEALHKVVAQFQRDGYDQRHPWCEHDWDVMWSFVDPYGGERPVGPPGLRADQLINRYPESPFTLKSRLAQMPFGFIPRAFDLPRQQGDFTAAYRDSPRRRWVRKNRSHRGVHLTSPHDIELYLARSARPIFVQEFVDPPHLIGRRKWDVGVYVLLTSLEPLRLHAYRDVVLRFCPKDFPAVLKPDDVGSYVVADDYTSPWDLEAFAPYQEARECPVDMLEAYLAHHEPERAWKDDLGAQCHAAIYDVVSLHAEQMLDRCGQYPAGQHQFFELYRFDFVFDAGLEAHLMEVNMSPNLSSLARPALDGLFTRLVRDVFGLVGIRGGPECLARKRQDPDFAATWERENGENWIPLGPTRRARRADEPSEGSPRPGPGTTDDQRQGLPKEPPEGKPGGEPTGPPDNRPRGERFRFSLHGAVVETEVPSSMMDALRQRLPPGARPDPEAPADVAYRLGADLHLIRGGELRLRASSSEEALDALVSDLHFQLACHARTALFVHAGVVVLDDTAILFPGRSHSGKSTLVAALVEAGARYFSDEYAVLDERGRVHPYLKPISLRDADGIAWPHSVESLGGHSGSIPVPVGLIVHTRYEPAATWAPRPLSPAQALLAMVENTVRAREKSELMIRVLADVAESSAAIASDRGEASEVVRFLLERHASLPRGV